MNDSPSYITRREALRRAALLLGAAISAPTVVGVLAGCGRGTVGGAGGLRALSAGQHRLVSVVAEHIIPDTDTPGALAAGVPEFVDAMLAGYYTEAERARFLAGLSALAERAEATYGEGFVDCAPDQQLALLEELDREAFAPAPRPRAEPAPVASSGEGGDGSSGAGEAAEREPVSAPWIHGEGPRRPRPEVPFFRTMKELTVVGYYTSEVGATRELRHEPIPGRYEGCIPFSDVGRTWAV